MTLQLYLALALVLASSAGEPARLLAEAELEAAAMAGSDANKGLAAKAAASVANKGSKLTNILPFSGSSGIGKTGLKTPGPSAADDSVSAAQAAVVGRHASSLVTHSPEQHQTGHNDTAMTLCMA